MKDLKKECFIVAKDIGNGELMVHREPLFVDVEFFNSYADAERVLLGSYGLPPINNGWQVYRVRIEKGEKPGEEKDQRVPGAGC